MNTFTIDKIEEFNDISELTELHNNACTYNGEKYLDGFQVDIDVTVKAGDKKHEFHLVFQSEERNNGMMAYSNYGMDTADRYGCDADESKKLEEWLSEIEEYDFYAEVITACHDKALELSKTHYNFLTE